jgi:hypothetical protein
MSFELNPKHYKPGEGAPIVPNLPIEEHKRIVTAGIKMLGVKEHDIPDLQRLLNEAKARIKNVRDYATCVADGFQQAGHVLDHKKLTNEIAEKYLNNFVHYNKDELLQILTTFLTIQTMKEII